MVSTPGRRGLGCDDLVSTVAVLVRMKPARTSKPNVNTNRAPRSQQFERL